MSWWTCILGAITRALTQIGRARDGLPLAGLLITLLVAGPSISGAQVPPTPVYHWQSMPLNFQGPMVPEPADGKRQLEDRYALLPWWVAVDGGQTSPLFCKADAELFTRNDFPATVAGAYYSARTPKSVARTRGTCLANNGPGGVCSSWGCVSDEPTTYTMQALCPVGWVFHAHGSSNTCECPDGFELAKAADGSWQCARIAPDTGDYPDVWRADSSCPAGNPVLPGVGAKIHTEVDYEGAGAHPLSFVRSFRSLAMRPYVSPGAWTHWVHNWGRRIETYPVAGYRTSRAYLIRPDATQRIYATAGTGTWSPVQQGDRNRLVELRNSDGGRTGFQYQVWEDDSVEHYDAQGRLLKVVQRNGWTNTLTYSTSSTPAAIAPRPGLLISVRNHFGRELRFIYDGDSRLTQLLPPGAIAGSAPGLATSPIRYSHGELASLGAGMAPAGQLTRVTWQDGAARRYHYENASKPGLLTGITDELGVRIGTYTYDQLGRAVRTEGPAGSHTLDFVYYGDLTAVIDRSGPTPLNTVYRLQYGPGVVRPVSATAPCPQCGNVAASSAYTATGEVARSIGHDGRITFFGYDSKGRETERAVFGSAHNAATARPALNLAESVTSTTWHSTWNLPLQRAEPGRITVFAYTSNGMTRSESWQATTDTTGAQKFAATRSGSRYETTWEFDSRKLPTATQELVDGVLRQRWSETYNAFGDSTRIQDVTAGRSATVSGYDAHGRVLTGTTDGSVSIAVTHTPRGLLAGVQRDAALTQYGYDGRGLLVWAQLPTGDRFELTYDARGKFVSATHNGQLIDQRLLAAGTDRSSRRHASALTGTTVMALLDRLASSLVRPAFAQVIVFPDPRPPTPQFDPRLDMLLAPFTKADALKRADAERRQRQCQCNPNGGYFKPTLTPGTYMHLWWGGHMKGMFSNKSYFTVPANQGMVDYIVSMFKGEVDGDRLVYRATMPDYIGMLANWPTDGVFSETKKVTLIVQADDCTRTTHARNEVVTMYPGHGKKDGP